MTEDAPRVTVRDVAFEDVKVGTADGRLDHPDDSVRGCSESGSWTVFKGLSSGAQIGESFHFQPQLHEVCR